MFERVFRELNDEKTKSFWWIFKVATTKGTDDLEIFEEVKESVF